MRKKITQNGSTFILHKCTEMYKFILFTINDLGVYPKWRTRWTVQPEVTHIRRTRWTVQPEVMHIRRTRWTVQPEVMHIRRTRRTRQTENRTTTDTTDTIQPEVMHSGDEINCARPPDLIPSSPEQYPFVPLIRFLGTYDNSLGAETTQTWNQPWHQPYINVPTLSFSIETRITDLALRARHPAWLTFRKSMTLAEKYHILVFLKLV